MKIYEGLNWKKAHMRDQIENESLWEIKIEKMRDQIKKKRMCDEPK